LDIDLVGEGEVGFEKPGSKIAVGPQGKSINSIIINYIIHRSKNVKNDYRDAEGYDKSVFGIKIEEIKEIFIPARINRIGI
jgi:hypothetical protein